MADNVSITPGSGTDVTTDQAADGSHMQLVKLAYSANADKTPIGADANGLDVDVVRLPSGTVAGSSSLPAGTNNIGDIDVLTVPSDPFGANADAASVTGSISAKLRFMAVTGIPVTALPASTNTIEVVGDVAHDAPAAGNPVLIAGKASAAAPTDVSTDGDAVTAWRLRNGAAAVAVTAAGALIGGDAANGMDVDVTRVPTDPFGANADAASATGSISAKLRFIAATGIPVTSLPAVQDSQVVADNAAFTDGTSKVFMSGFVFDEVAGTALTENDAAAARIDAKRAVVIALEDATTRGQRASIDSSGRVATIPAGGIAHDGVDSGNPVKVGARAVASLATATMVSAADRADNVADLDGVQLVRPAVPLGDIKSDAISNTDGTSTASSVFTAVASTKNCISGAVVFNTSSTAGYIDFRDGTAGSVLWRLPLPANGGAVLPNSGVPWFRTSANTALAYDVSAALTTVYVSVTGFQSKV